MAYCQNCGQQIDDKAVVCIHCGVAVKNVVKPNDGKSCGFVAISFFFPVIGLILYLVWKDDYPLKASSCGKGALAGVIAYVVGIVIYIILIAILAASIPYAAVLPALL